MHRLIVITIVLSLLSLLATAAPPKQHLPPIEEELLDSSLVTERSPERIMLPFIKSALRMKVPQGHLWHSHEDKIREASLAVAIKAAKAYSEQEMSVTLEFDASKQRIISSAVNQYFLRPNVIVEEYDPRVTNLTERPRIHDGYIIFELTAGQTESALKDLIKKIVASAIENAESAGQILLKREQLGTDAQMIAA